MLIDATLSTDVSARTRGQQDKPALGGARLRAPLPGQQQVRRRGRADRGEGHEDQGSGSSVKLVSRSHPSFSTLTCCSAMALALESRSGMAWYSDTQQR